MKRKIEMKRLLLGTVVSIGLMLSLSACAPSGPSVDTETVAAEKVTERPGVKMSSADIAALHDRVLTLDTHIDIPLTYMTEIDPTAKTDLQVDLPKLAAGKLDSGFWIVYTPQGDLDASGYQAASEIADTRVRAIGLPVSYTHLTLPTILLV